MKMKTETYKYKGKIFQIQDRSKDIKFYYERVEGVEAWDYSLPERFFEAKKKGVKIKKDYLTKITRRYPKEVISEWLQ